MTARLQLIQLTDEQLAVATKEWRALESKLGLAPSAYTLSPVEKRAIESKRRKLAANPGCTQWYTYWLIVLREREAEGAIWWVYAGGDV